MLEYSIDIPPIFTASVFVHPNARLLLQDYSERSRILTGIALPSYLEKLAKKYPPVITSHQVELLSGFLESHHQSAVINILEKYEVLWEDLIKGVRCPSCNQYAMKRNRMRWECPHCGTRSQKAHLRALYELALLMDNRITNRMAREFLSLDSTNAMQKIFARAGIYKSGISKNASYSIDLIKWRKNR